MLTSDLVRARVQRGKVRPGFLASDEAELARCGTVLDAWTSHVGLRRDELDDTLSALEGDGTDFQIWRGLSKLVGDASEFVSTATLDPVAVRAAVFACSVGRIPRDDEARRQILEEVAGGLGCSVDDVEANLYADLEARAILASTPTWSPEQLQQRYNVALAQGVLYKASSLTMTVLDKRVAPMRAVFNALRFFGLMYRVREVSDGWEIEVDGPASIVTQSRKYGVALATFLPVVFHCDRWKLQADIQWTPKREVSFELSSDEVDLRAPHRLLGNWISDEEKLLLARFAEGVDGWTLRHETTLVALDRGEVLVCNYVLAQEGKPEVAVDVVGFWRSSYLQRRVEYLKAARQPVVMVVAERLRTQGGELESAGLPVVFFKGVIKAASLIEAAELALTRPP